MPLLRYLLCLPLLLGLLQPPGVCLCDIAKLLAHEQQGCDPEPNDHDERCPCAKMPSLASARGSDVAKPADATCFAVSPLGADLGRATAISATILDEHHPPSRPLYLTLRALRN